jgi:hypothetical protein
VDFTKSNLQSGMRTFQNQSLHQLFNDGRLNPYQEVIQAIGATLSTQSGAALMRTRRHD